MIDERMQTADQEIDLKADECERHVEVGIKVRERLPDMPEGEALADGIVENQQVIIPQHEAVEERPGVDDERQQENADDKEEYFFATNLIH